DSDRVPTEDATGPRGGGARSPDLCPQEQHDRPDAGLADLDLRPGTRSSGRRDARDGGRDRGRPAARRACGAISPERVHPAPPAPDGRAGEPRLAPPRPRAVSPGPALPGRREERLAALRTRGAWRA